MLMLMLMLMLVLVLVLLRNLVSSRRHGLITRDKPI